ncbi:hypothetical protein Bca52824_064066 [Brassica carinata]|uniref:Glycine-rich protein n=1 Tax=Brassica carinata TaxID=52824 RepID=A0A8X7UAZ2_BRACI|nr:hypothetical protein Bca52824_064066 [Brassica carinata]
MVRSDFTGVGVGLGLGVGCGFGLGGGCGMGLGLGWGFGTAFGSHYRSSRLTFQGIQLGKADNMSQNT